MFVLNGTIIIFVVSFLVFMKLLDLIMLSPVGKAIARRQEKIAADLSFARDARTQAAGLLENYESGLREKRDQAQVLVSAAVNSANQKKAEDLAALTKEALVKLEGAKEALAAERNALMDELVVQERTLVEEITSKVLGEPVAIYLDPQRVRKHLEEAGH
jgi:F-type H+-transporting ATPase subunit b